MMNLVWLLMILAALALLIVPMMRARRGPRGEMLRGTLLVTGVSGSKSGPDSSGQQLVTITGVINGPSVNEHVVYQQVAINTGSSPKMGDLIPVVYSGKNPDNWFFAPPEQQLPPPAQP
jgi:hypothetical protein